MEKWSKFTSIISNWNYNYFTITGRYLHNWHVGMEISTKFDKISLVSLEMFKQNWWKLKVWQWSNSDINTFAEGNGKVTYQRKLPAVPRTHILTATFLPPLYLDKLKCGNWRKTSKAIDWPLKHFLTALSVDIQ